MTLPENAQADSQHIPPSQEVNEETVKRNVLLLNAALLGRTEGTQFADQRSFPGVYRGEVRVTSSGMSDTSIVLVYRTATGQIEYPDQGFSLGEYSRLHTVLRTDSETSQVEGRRVTANHSANIHMLLPSGSLSVQQLNATVIGEEAPEDERRIMPERMVPEHPRLMGLYDRWAEDSNEIGIDPSGDVTLLASLRTFNTQNERPAVPESS